MRIAICTDIYLPQLSGVSDSIALLASELTKRGHEVRIYAPRNGVTEKEGTVKRLPCVTVPGSAGNMFLVFPRGMLSDMRAFKPDLIHTHTFSTVGLAAVHAARRLKVPLIGTDHTFPALYLKYVGLNFAPVRFFMKKFAAWYYNRCTIVTTPSKSMHDELVQYGMRRPSHLISNPIDFDLFRPATDRAVCKKKYDTLMPTILIFQRIAEEKNLDFSLDIFKAVRAKMRTALLVVGDGPYRTHLERRVYEEHIADVHFTGTLRGAELVTAINAADVYLITSIENQAMTVLQSMAAALPVVGADIGGLPEQIVDGKSGFLITPGDTDAFVQKLELLLRDETMSRAFGREGSTLVEKYSCSYVGNEFEKLYTECISKK